MASVLNRAGTPAGASPWIPVHPLVVRVTHWVNVLAISVMLFSGWRIYDASPLFAFSFPPALTLGAWLAGALQWHFAGMWLLVGNGLAYVVYGLVSGHYRRSFFPIDRHSVFGTLAQALRGHLAHRAGTYNVLQRLAYLGIIVVLVLIVTSGLAMWKPVQFQAIASLLGGYEGARRVHFFCMSAIVLFVVIHVAMVAIVPRTFVPMWTGYARGDREERL